MNDTIASIIKGMIERGDDSQDIAIYFGINIGRVSEIRNNKTYQNIEPLHTNLPPKGPYPSFFELEKNNIFSIDDHLID